MNFDSEGCKCTVYVAVCVFLWVCVSQSGHTFNRDEFLDPEGSLSARTAVLVLVLVTGGVVTRFRKMPKALLIRNGKLRNFAHIRDIIPDRSTVLGFGPGKVPKAYNGCSSCSYSSCCC